MRSLNRLWLVRAFGQKVLRFWLRAVRGIDLPSSSSLSFSAALIPGKRGAITIGSNSLIAFKSLVIARKTGGEVEAVQIGSNCFIGGGALILPGVTIGDHAIVGAGAVVFDDVPARTIVAGNPARIIRENIETGRFGRLNGADENSARLWR